jgi:hypothetical protein
VAKPSANDIDIDTCFEEMNSCAMTKGVRKQAAVVLTQSATLQHGRVPLYDLVNPESCQWLLLLRNEHGRVFLSRSISRELFEQFHRLRPDGTSAPLVAFSVKPDSIGLIEIQVCGANVGSLLNARTSVIEEHQERTVS